MNSELFERSLKVSPGGVHSPVRGFRGVGGTPRFIREAKGPYLTDVEGKRYIDYCMSWGPLLFGHQDPEVRQAVDEALSRGWSFGAAEPYSLELAEFITGSIPWVKKIRFVSSGTEAVMSALRVVRAATGREKIVKFDGCYHGHVDSMLVRAGSGLAEMASPDSAGVSPKTASDTLVAPLDDEAALAKIFAEHGREIAAVIVEALPANNGLLPQRKEYLHKVVDIAQSHRALVIFDEVITGFRVRFGGMAEALGIRPDLVTYGKVLGGGFPVGAYGGRTDLMDWVAPAGTVYQAGTLSAQPVAMVAGLTTLRKLKREQPYAKLSDATAYLARELSQLAVEAGVPSVIQNEASLFWGIFGRIEAADGIVRSIGSIPPTQKDWFSRFFHGMLERGVYLAPSGYEVGFLSTAHTQAVIDETLEAARAELKKLAKSVSC